MPLGIKQIPLVPDKDLCMQKGHNDDHDPIRKRDHPDIDKEVAKALESKSVNLKVGECGYHPTYSYECSQNGVFVHSVPLYGDTDHEKLEKKIELSKDTTCALHKYVNY